MSGKTKLLCVGRVQHNYYMHGNKLVSNSSFTVLKRKSQLELPDLISDALYDIQQLCLQNYEEGLYSLELCNPSRDWETGIIDDWDLQLVPYKEGE